MTRLEDISVDPELPCSACGGPIERGYVPVKRTDGAEKPLGDLAVCETCAWRDVGHAGCAPELRDFETGDLLVRVEAGESGLVPAAVTDDR